MAAKWALAVAQVFQAAMNPSLSRVLASDSNAVKSWSNQIDSESRTPATFAVAAFLATVHNRLSANALAVLL